MEFMKSLLNNCIENIYDYFNGGTIDVVRREIVLENSLLQCFKTIPRIFPETIECNNTRFEKGN
jgi:hypothetical protein